MFIEDISKPLKKGIRRLLQVIPTILTSTDAFQKVPKLLEVLVLFPFTALELNFSCMMNCRTDPKRAI